MHDEDFRNELADDLRILWDQLDSIPDETANSPAMKIRFNAMLDAYQQKMDRSPRWLFSIAVCFIFAIITAAGAYRYVHRQTSLTVKPAQPPQAAGLHVIVIGHHVQGNCAPPAPHHSGRAVERWRAGRALPWYGPAPMADGTRASPGAASAFAAYVALWVGYLAIGQATQQRNIVAGLWVTEVHG